MRNRSIRLMWAIGLVLLTLGRAQAAPADEATVRSRLTTCYQDLAECVKNGDVKRMAAMLTDDYFEIDGEGHTSHRDEVLDALKNLGMKKIDASYKIVSIKINDDFIEVTAANHLAGTVTNKQGVQERMVVDNISTDTWTPTAGGYLMAKSITIGKDNVTIDGKPVKP